MRFVVACALALELGACADSPPAAPAPCAATELCPRVAYSGSDGQSIFRTYFRTSMPNVTWSVEDPNVAGITPVGPLPGDPSSWAVVDAFAPGTIQVIATSGGTSLEATLVVQAYSTAGRDVAADRIYAPDDPGGAREACVTCHGRPDDPWPLLVQAFSDEELLQIITARRGHRWNLTDAERAGIVPYLRSIVPPVVD